MNKKLNLVLLISCLFYMISDAGQTFSRKKLKLVVFDGKLFPIRNNFFNIRIAAQVQIFQAMLHH